MHNDNVNAINIQKEALARRCRLAFSLHIGVVNRKLSIVNVVQTYDIDCYIG